MKNVWKGLIIGGLTGAAAGMALDGVNWGAGTAAVLGERALQHAPEVASRVRETVGDVVADGADKVHSAGIPGRLKEAADAQGHKAGVAADDGRQSLSTAATSGREKAAAALAGAKAKVESSATAGKEAVAAHRA